MKRPSLFFRIHRWLYFLLKGIGKKETEHYLFTLKEPLGGFEIYQRLADCGWQPNVFGYIYSGQIYQCRRLLHRGKHELHVRIYDDGRVTGHFEIAVEWDEKQHLAGIDLRTMNEYEAQRLKDNITGVTVLRRKYPLSRD